MLLYHIIILALIQGITEFLPVSSSGHLVLAHAALSGNAQADWQDDLMIDLAVHVGTLFSVLAYFRRDILSMLGFVTRLGRTEDRAAGGRLLAYVIVGSIPVIFAGLALHVLEPAWLRSVELVAWTTLIFGIVLYAADKFRPAHREFEVLRMRDAIWIGLAQTVALLPGTSRSGITMTAARALGFERVAAARFSILLASVAISGAGALGVLKLIRDGNPELGLQALTAAVLAFVSGWITMALMMRWLDRADFTIFAVYRVVLGGALLAAVYTGLL